MFCFNRYNHLSPILLLIILKVMTVQSHAPASCTTLTFKEDREDRWEATLNVKVPEQLNGVWIKVDLDNKADVLITDFGATTSTNNQNFIIRRPDLRFSPGEILKAELTVKFSGVGTVPNITQITINSRTVCPLGPDDLDVRVQEPESKPSSTQDSCGLVPESQSLIYNGELSSEGEWPWHVALMQVSPPKVTYNCGGSIISESFILTAAHCVTFPRTNSLVRTQSLLIYIGITKLTNFDIPSIKIFTAADILIPNDYDPETFFNDIALIQLSGRLRFTNFIRPICLWSEDGEQSAIIGRRGTVVGWGVDHRNQTFSSDLRHAEIPVISMQTCRQQGDFYGKHTNEKTYCAGGEEEKSVCRGDSGGGMIFRRKGTLGKDSVWQVRGVVSLTKKHAVNTVCNTEDYTIFTDVAKHLKWIKSMANIA